MKFGILYLLIMNVAGFVLMWVDKRKAVRKEWRIPEKTLFLCSLFGGCLGTWAGMYAFRHKTRHWYFVLGMPLILFLWILGILWGYRHFPDFFQGL